MGFIQSSGVLSSACCLVGIGACRTSMVLSAQWQKQCACAWANYTGPLDSNSIFAIFAACLLGAMFLLRLEGNFNLNTLNMREIYDWCRWYFQQQDDGRLMNYHWLFYFFKTVNNFYLTWLSNTWITNRLTICVSCFCCTLDLSWFSPNRSGNHWITTGRCMESWAHSDGGVEVRFFVRSFLTLFRR